MSADIVVQKAHGLGVAEATKRLTALAPQLEADYGIRVVRSQRSTPTRGTFLVGGAGVGGEVKIGDDIVLVELTLGFLARPFKGRIERGLNAELGKVLR